MTVATHFQRQGDACARLGSPFTARLCHTLPEVLDRSTLTGSRVLDWPGDPAADALALRLCGGFHALALSGEVAVARLFPPSALPDPEFREALANALASFDARLVRALDSAPQTNEIARSAMLLPGFLQIACETGLPLALAEIGASAGLNLRFDRFSYHYGDQTWGEASSPVQLAPEVRGTPPPLGGDLRISARTGCDIAPVSVDDPAHRLRLRSFIWPDQPQRLARLDAAIEVAGKVEASLVAADAADFVASRLAQRRDGEALVIFHSIMWQYMPEATRATILKSLEEADRAAGPNMPIAHLRMEPIDLRDGFATLILTLWPGGETQSLARCDFHGRWIDWIG